MITIEAKWNSSMDTDAYGVFYVTYTRCKRSGILYRSIEEMQIKI